jgi:hypothetical protein
MILKLVTHKCRKIYKKKKMISKKLHQATSRTPGVPQEIFIACFFKMQQKSPGKILGFFWFRGLVFKTVLVQ